MDLSEQNSQKDEKWNNRYLLITVQCTPLCPPSLKVLIIMIDSFFKKCLKLTCHLYPFPKKLSFFNDAFLFNTFLEKKHAQSKHHAKIQFFGNFRRPCAVNKIWVIFLTVRGFLVWKLLFVLKIWRMGCAEDRSRLFFVCIYRKNINSALYT